MGSELVSYLVYLARKNGILGLTAKVLAENQPMLSILKKTGFKSESRSGEVISLRVRFSS